MMGETIPKKENQIYLDKQNKDPWGIPQLVVNVDYDDNDDKMTKDYINELSEMFERAGFKNIKSRDNFKRKPGNDIH